MNNLKKFSALLIVALATLAGCSSSPSSNTAQEEPKIQATASFFPIKWLVEEIGGDHVNVKSATPTTVEPHDYEFSPKEVSAISSSDVVFYVKGFQPSLDQTVEQMDSKNSVELSDAAQLVAHPENSDWDTYKTGHGPQVDPHFWLDPQRMQMVADRINQALSQMDPAHAEYFGQRTAQVNQELAQLDQEFQAGLATCKERALVSSHAAFGYLADRYKLVPLSVTGVDPDAEPSPANLRTLKYRMKDFNSSVIFTEALASPKVAETFAQEVGATTAKLDALESDTTQQGYLAAMRANLDSLHNNLKCQ